MEWNREEKRKEGSNRPKRSSVFLGTSFLAASFSPQRTVGHACTQIQIWRTRRGDRHRSLPAQFHSPDPIGGISATVYVPTTALTPKYSY